MGCGVGMGGAKPRADVIESERVVRGCDPPSEFVGTRVGGTSQSGHLQAVLPHVGALIGVPGGDEGCEATRVRGRVGGRGLWCCPRIPADQAICLVEPGRVDDGCGHG